MKALRVIFLLLLSAALFGCSSSPPRVSGRTEQLVLPARQIPVRILLKTDKPNQFVPVRTVMGTTYENIPADAVLVGLETLRRNFPRIERWKPNSPPGPVLLVSVQASGYQGFSGTNLSSSIRGTLYDRKGQPYEMFRGRAAAESDSSHARVVYKTHKTALAQAYKRMAMDMLRWQGLNYFINENR